MNPAVKCEVVPVGARTASKRQKTKSILAHSVKSGGRTYTDLAYPRGKTNAVYDRSRAVGFVRNGVLVRHAQASKHFLRSPAGISFAVQALREAIDLGAKSVSVLDVESGITYNATILDFNSKGIAIERSGWSKQICLTMNHWQILDPRHPEKQLELLGASYGSG